MRESSYKAVAAALCAVLAGELCVFGYLVHSANQQAAELASQPETELVVNDTPLIAYEPPVYYQGDEQWGGLPYATADSTVSESGCGLCAAASAAAYLTGKDYITPSYLLNLVGNRCIEDGVNHMGLFCQELEAMYRIEWKDLWTLEDAESYLRDGWGIFAGMSGSVYEGGKSYGAHVLYVWACDEDGVYIRDSADPGLQSPVSWDEFRAVQWSGYFYAIRKGEVI